MKNICFQMTRKAVLVAALILAAAFPALAQKITVTGTVFDPYGDPLIGASVIAQGTTTGVATDFDGNFTITVEPDAVLQISYVGFNPKEVPVNGQTHIEVTLEENTVMLQEVVAIGYGTVKKSDATGSVAVVKPDDIEAGLATSVQDMLVGQTPGVVVTTSGGPYGSAQIRIRGGSSLNANNDPLIVVDGVPLSNDGVQGMDNPLSMINPESVESMTVLKDASATAIYGSRASNGVIIITTKKGKSGKPTVSFAANMYINSDAKRWKVLTGDQYRDLIDGLVSSGTINSEVLTVVGDYNTDWQDEILRTTVSSDYTLSISGSTGWLPYRVSASYTNSNGILINSAMDRTTVGVNLNPRFFDGKLQVNANVNGYYIRSQFSDTGAVSGAIAMNPTQPVYSYQSVVGDAGQQYLWNGYYEQTGTDGLRINENATQNPVAQIRNIENKANVYRSTGNIQFDYAFHFLPDLHANLNLGYDVSKTDEIYNTAANSYQAWTNHDNYGGAYGLKRYEFRSNTLLDFYLNYKKEFEEAANQMVDVTAGYSWQRFHGDGWHSGADSNSGYRMTPGLSSPFINSAGEIELNYDSSTTSLVGQNFSDDEIGEGGNYHWANRLQLLSFFGRLNYGILDRYLLTFTVRADATSRFAKNNRWGYFPSAALAWKINNESFMEDARSWLSDLKLRLGWGMTGQQDVGSTVNYLPTYTISSPQSYYPNGLTGWYVPYYPDAYNASLKWETTTTYNAGLDFGFLNNRITGSIEVYKRVTKDLLAYVSVPAGMMTTNMFNQNIGTLENYGVEFNIQATAIRTNDFSWTVGYNVGYNHNEITALNSDSAYFTTGGISGSTGSTVQVHAVGHAASSFYLFQQVYDEFGYPIEGVYVDQNGDGQIDDNDKIIEHSPDPKVTMTFNSAFRYKNWDLGFALRASIGNYVYNNVESNRANYSHLWENQGTSNIIVADHYFLTQQLMSDYYLRNASFLRCDNITLGYTWDNLYHEKLKLRLFGGVQNPFVITKYSGLDPEVASGIDNSVYPRSITYSLGLVATF